MDDPAEEDVGESLEEESPADPPTAGLTDNQEDDNQKNQDQEEAYDQTDHRTADQNAQRLSGEPEPIMFDQANHKDSEHLENSPYDQADRKSSEQTDDKTYDQIENVADAQTDGQVPGLTDQEISEQTEGSWSRQAQRKASEQADHRMSTQSERQASIQADRRMSSQSEKRTSGQTDDRLSIPSDPTFSGQTESRTYDQAERKTFEKIDQRPSGSSDPGTSEENVDRQAEKIIYEKVDRAYHGSYVKIPYNVDDQATEGAEQQTFDQADQLKVDEDDFSQPDQADYGVDKEAYLKDYPSSFVSEYGLFPQFGDGKEDQDRVQPCTFEDSETLLKSTLSVEMETENVGPLQSEYPTDTRFTGHFLGKDQSFYRRLPSISTKPDVLSQEKNQATGISPDDYSESEQAKSSHMINQVIYKRRPPVVYEDPYEVSLQYMEKHNILQIFQITENLVYEKPDDPLSFMLGQVQEMMKNRDKT